MSENFELECECKANDVIPVYKYKSKRTSLTVVIAQVEGPLVNGYFCLATEAHDDDGLPHTLEHLVFMGSEKYPYKGVLDLLANRCLASGTNAWTDTDHTCYTMTTAGSEGFLTLLPIYLDHILYPTLTESAYLTEVHHVNTEGEDAGVVYCEMQARENTGESRTHLAMLRAMYPGQCGYKSETGGMMANLRTSTSHKKVCDYHQEFYRPENLCLIITGQVEPQEVFKSLQSFEDKIMAKGPRTPFTRPWQSPVPPLAGSTNQVIKYSSDEEDHGIVVTAWRAPPGKDQFEILALIVLMEYLTDTSVAPLQRDFVELDDPYCSRVRYSIIENAESCMYVTFENVPRGKLGGIHDRLEKLVAKIGGGEEAIDMSRMASVTHRKILESMSNLEDQPHDSLAVSVIGDFLNSDTKEELAVRLNHVAALRDLKNKSKEFWLSMFNKYMVGKPTVTIVGEPSKKLMEETGEEEKKRVAAQREKLGAEGLDQLGKRLQKAKDENEVEAPEEVLTSVSVPDVTCIKFHGIKPSSNHGDPPVDSNPKFPLADVPVTFQLDDIQTNFATMVVMMDTASVPDDLRLYMPLLLEVLMESPVMRDGVLVPYEDVVRELAADTLDSSAALGLGGRKFACGQFAQVANLSLKVEREKYQRGVQWLHELLYQTQFTVERLRIVATKMVNEVAKVRRNGHFIARTLCQALVFTKESNHYVVSMLRQHKFLSAVLTRLDKETEAQKVIDDMNNLRGILTTPANMRVHLSISVETLPADVKPDLPWKLNFLPKESKKGEKGSTIKSDSALLSSSGEGPGTGMIIGSGSVESSYLIQTSPGITNPEDPDLVAVMVFIQYLTQLEGPMWRQVRGLGLAYHYSMYIKPDSGLVYFILFKSTHVVNAYKVARQIVDDFLTGKTAFSEVEFETCKSSLIFEVIEEEKTPSDASQQSALSYLRGVNHDYNRRIIKKIPKVTLDDLRRVGHKYLLPLFDTAKSKCAIVCHPTKVKEISDGFKELSRELVEVESLDKSFLSEVNLVQQDQQQLLQL